MKTWKLVSGILSIVLFAFVMLQSCAVGAVNAMADNGDFSGSAGLLVSILLLSGGIVSIVTRGSEKKGGNIALIVLFGLAALIGFTSHGIYADLIVWSAWCLINAGLAAVSLVLGKKKTGDKAPDPSAS